MPWRTARFPRLRHLRESRAMTRCPRHSHRSGSGFSINWNRATRPITSRRLSRLVGPLDVSALGQALSEVVRRHEVLRTTLVSDEGNPAPGHRRESRIALGAWKTLAAFPRTSGNAAARSHPRGSPAAVRPGSRTACPCLFAATGRARAHRRGDHAPRYLRWLVDRHPDS